VDALLWKRIGELFDAARELDHVDQVEFLKQQCGDDQALLEQVLSLLDADNNSGILDSKPTVSDLLVPTIVAGRFRIVRFIAEGGMGSVYEAEDLQLQERVALKTIRADIASNPRAVEHFKREIHLGKTVTHPNVCRIHDLVVDHSESGAEVLFLSMQFLDGETLATRIKRGPVPETEALPFIGDMAAGLSALHEAGVIHRDFKSGNVMLVPQSNRTHAVITDFGLARALGDTDLRSSLRMAGTVDYMAPEQIRGEELTPTADIYALGVVLYEMATGQRPFTGDSKITIAMKHLHDEPQPPRVLTPQLDQRWNETIMHCLEKTPSKRFQSAAELKAAIEESRPSWKNLLPTPKNWTMIKRLLVLSLALLVVSFAVILVVRKSGRQQIATQSPRVAVLPFETLGTTTNHDYLAEGLADEIAGLLSRVHTLQVIAPVSVQRFKGSELPLTEVSRQLQAHYFVTGSVESENKTVRIRIRMLDASTGILWARTYDRSASNKLSVENEVAQDVVQSLALTLGKDEIRVLSTPVTRNPQAFEAYLYGKSMTRAFNNRGQEDDFSAAEEALRRAIQLDPQMAAAYGELAHLYFLHDIERARPTAHSERLNTVAEQALAIDSKQLAALDALAMMYASTGRPDTAYTYALKVLTLNPHDPGALMVVGAVYESKGLLEDALAAFHKAREAEPLYLYPMTNAAETLVMLGRLDEAWLENEEAAAIEPDNYGVLLKRAWIRYHQGRLDEAEQAALAARSRLAASERGAAELIQAWVYSRRGLHDRAQALLHDVEQSPLVRKSFDLQLWLAEGWALEGEPSKSLPLLVRVARTYPNYPWLVLNDNLQSLRGNPEFDRLLAEVKTEWQSNILRFQKDAKILGMIWFRFYMEGVCPAAAMYNTDSRMPSMPISRSIKLSASAAEQNGARLRAVAIKQNV